MQDQISSPRFRRHKPLQSGLWQPSHCRSFLQNCESCIRSGRASNWSGFIAHIITSTEAQKTLILPALLNVKVLADNGYTTIFHPHDQEATIHHSNDLDIRYKDKAVLHGWRDDNRLWHIPLTKEDEDDGKVGATNKLNQQHVPITINFKGDIILSCFSRISYKKYPVEGTNQQAFGLFPQLHSWKCQQALTWVWQDSKRAHETPMTRY